LLSWQLTGRTAGNRLHLNSIVLQLIESAGVVIGFATGFLYVVRRMSSSTDETRGSVYSVII